MCFIGGCLILDSRTRESSERVERVLRTLLRVGGARGEDGAGFAVFGRGERSRRDVRGPRELADQLTLEPDARAVLLNSRLEPTCEYVPFPRPEDLQPYGFDGLTVVHNGIVANDAELRRRYAIGLDEVGSTVDSAVLPHVLSRIGGVSPAGLRRLASELEGSYALAVHSRDQPDRLYLACSYKPLWIARAGELGA